MLIPSLTGIILAGGQAKRMGGNDKGLINFANKPLYQYVLERLQPQVSDIIINANRNLDIYQKSGYRVITDDLFEFLGPLAGMLVGLKHSQTEWVVFTPCDTPFIPLNLTEQLWKSKHNRLASYVYDGKTSHPTLALLHIDLVSTLQHFLNNGERKLMSFFEQIQANKANFFDQHPSAFKNVNTLNNWQEQQQGKF